MCQVEKISSPRRPKDWDITTDKFWGDTYRTSCACGEPNHAMTFSVEVDEGVVLLDMNANLIFNTHNYTGYSWFEKKWYVLRRKISAIYDIIFKGYIETNESFIFRGEEQIDEVCGTILEAKTIMMELRQRRANNGK